MPSDDFFEFLVLTSITKDWPTSFQINRNRRKQSRCFVPNFDVTAFTKISWRGASPSLPPCEFQLALPPVNPYVPESFDIKPLPDSDRHYPLVNCFLKVCVSVGKSKVGQMIILATASNIFSEHSANFFFIDLVSSYLHNL